MKFALNSLVVRNDDPGALAQQCQQLGYDGIDLHPEPTADPGVLRSAFDEAGRQIACISCSVRYRGDARRDSTSADEVRRILDLARHMGCHLIKIPDPDPIRRQSVMTTISDFAGWLGPLADAAADRAITILVENTTTLLTARSLWSLAERADHSAMGICWNADNSIAAGESPAVTIPTLNSRIRCVSTANVDFNQPMTRLRGIGYSGWIIFSGPLANAENFLETARVHWKVGASPAP